MKRMRSSKNLSVLLVLTMIFTLFPIQTFAAADSDIAGHWAEKTIQSWLGQGLMNGYPDGTFKPNQPITRAELVSLVNKSFGYTEEAADGFTDVPSNAWYAQAVGIAKAAGYLEGYPDQTIRPKQYITRQEVAKVIATVKNLTGDESAVDKFTDSVNIPAWSKGFIGAMVTENYMSGYPDGTFQPTQNITRAEAVVALNNVLQDTQIVEEGLETTYDQAGTYGSKENVEIVENDVRISASDVTLINMNIKGDLIIGKEVAEGEVTLNNVTVEGQTFIYGGGENSIICKDSSLNKVTVDKENNTVRILATGTTVIKEVVVQSGAKLEESNVSEAGFQDIIIDAEDKASVKLIGKFDTVKAVSKNAIITLESGARVAQMIVDEVVTVTGTGTIEKAEVNVSGVKFDKKPRKLTLADGVANPIIKYSASSSSSSSSSSNSDDDSDDDSDDSSDAPSVATIRISEDTGSAEERQTLQGNVIVDTPGIILTNLEITGDLTIAEEVGEGDVHLNDVTVRGETIVAGGGENSIHFTNFVSARIVVNKRTGGVRVVLNGSSQVNIFEVESAVRIDTSGLTEEVNPPGVQLNEGMPERTSVTLAGSFNTVSSLSRQVIINLDTNTSIEELVLSAVAEVLGTQNVSIRRATVNNGASGSRLDSRPAEIVAENSVSLELEGVTYEPGQLANAVTLEQIHVTMNSIGLQFVNNARLLNGSLTSEDFEVTATLDGEPYVLENLTFESNTDRFVFNPIPYEYLDQTLEVTVTPNSNRVLGEVKTGSKIVTQGFGGRIINVFGFGVPNMEINFKNSEADTNVLATVTTDAFGYYSVDLEPGTYYAELVHEDYIRTYEEVQSYSGYYLTQQDFIAVLSAQTGQIKIELTWGTEPRDLDSHLLGPVAPADSSRNSFHVYYGDNTYSYGVQGIYADLDRDDLTSYGPETITIRQLLDGQYRYYVHNFSGEVALGDSQAKVKVYEGTEEGTDVLGEFTLPLGAGSQGHWVVFDILVEGGQVSIVPIEQMSGNAPSLLDTNFDGYMTDEQIVQVEASRYNDQVIIGNEVAVGDEVTALLQQLNDFGQPREFVNVAVELSENSAYFQLTADGKVVLTQQNIELDDVTEEVTLVFTKGEAIYTKTILVTIQAQTQQGPVENPTVVSTVYGATYDANAQVVQFQVGRTYTDGMDINSEFTGTTYEYLAIAYPDESTETGTFTLNIKGSSATVTDAVYSAVYSTVYSSQDTVIEIGEINLALVDLNILSPVLTTYELRFNDIIIARFVYKKEE